MGRTLKNRASKKSRKGGINISPLLGALKGCPAGKVRAHGSQCGFIRSGSGCCIDSAAVKIGKEKSFFHKLFGGKRKTHRRKTHRRKTHRRKTHRRK